VTLFISDSNRQLRSAGVAGVVALPVVGLAVGVTQVARGFVNTPEAIAAKAAGKHWDQVGSLASWDTACCFLCAVPVIVPLKKNDVNWFASTAGLCSVTLFVTSQSA